VNRVKNDLVELNNLLTFEDLNSSKSYILVKSRLLPYKEQTLSSLERPLS